MRSAIVYITPPAHFEYLATIEDGSKPAPYIERFEVIQPPGRSCTIVQKADSWPDALEQLQAIADEYGTLEHGALIMPLLCDPDDGEHFEELEEIKGHILEELSNTPK